MNGNIDARDVGALEKSVNDAAGGIIALWLSFISFVTFLLIAAGTVTHTHLFLEKALKLPILLVELPLLNFFFWAPLLLLIFHFYVFHQLYVLAHKISDYEVNLTRAIKYDSDRRLMRQRLHTFVFIQMLAGASEPRRERHESCAACSGRIIAWITTVSMPLVTLGIMLIIFLPYHSEPMTWWHRGVIIFDIILVFFFWSAIRSRVASENSFAVRLMERLRLNPLLAVFCVIFFVLFVWIPRFPGEWFYGCWGQSWTEWAFVTKSDPETGRQDLRPCVSNNLDLRDQDLIDHDKLKDGVVTVSLRKRNLRYAVLDRADLRLADFASADLQGAWLDGTRLQGASFTEANLQGASLDGALLQAATLDKAKLQGASLKRAFLQAASLVDANLQGASLKEAWLQGASLDLVKLQGASLDEAQLQVALLTNARLDGASLVKTLVYRTHAIQVSTHEAYLRELETAPSLHKYEKGHTLEGLTISPKNFELFQDMILRKVPSDQLAVIVRQRLQRLQSSTKRRHEVREDTRFWQSHKKESEKMSYDQYQRLLAPILEDLACNAEGTPDIVRGLIRNCRLLDTGPLFGGIVEKFKDPKKNNCHGAKSFTAAGIDEMVEQTKNNCEPPAAQKP